MYSCSTLETLRLYSGWCPGTWVLQVRDIIRTGNNHLNQAGHGEYRIKDPEDAQATREEGKAAQERDPAGGQAATPGR